MKNVDLCSYISACFIFSPTILRKQLHQLSMKHFLLVCVLELLQLPVSKKSIDQSPPGSWNAALKTLVKTYSLKIRESEELKSFWKTSKLSGLKSSPYTKSLKVPSFCTVVGFSEAKKEEYPVSLIFER